MWGVCRVSNIHGNSPIVNQPPRGIARVPTSLNIERTGRKEAMSTPNDCGGVSASSVQGPPAEGPTVPIAALL